MKKKLITIVFVIITLLIFQKIDDAMDFFKIKKNHISIHLNSASCANNLSIFLLQNRDTTLLFKDGVQIVERTSDWYGKDHIVILREDTVCCTNSFANYKLISWDKIKYNLLIEPIDSGKCLLNWSLESTSMSNSGHDTLR